METSRTMNVIANQKEPTTPAATDVVAGATDVYNDAVPRVFWLQVALVVACILAFMASITLSITPRYETIDDIVMHEYVAGLFFSLKPDEHMIYSHVLLGKLLAGLYTAAFKVPWYPLYQLLAILTSSTVICSALIRLYGGRGAIVPSLIYAFVVLAPAIICMQFTTTAAIVGIAGGVLLISAIESKANLQWRWSLAAGGAFAFVFSALMRQKAGWMVAVLFALYAVVRYSGKSWKRLGIALSATAALVVVSQLFWIANDNYYKQTGWGEFEVWRRKLHPLYDFSRLDLKSDKAVASIEKVGWSRNDVKMLNTCMHWDKAVFSSAKLNALVEQGHQWVRSDLQTYLPASLSGLLNHQQTQIVFFLLVSSFLIVAGPQLSSLRFAALFASVAGVAAVVTGTHKASLHVYLPMLYMLAVARLTSLQFARRPEAMIARSEGALSQRFEATPRFDFASGSRLPLVYKLLILGGCVALFVHSLQQHSNLLKKAENSKARRDQLVLIHNSYPDKLAYTVVGAPNILPLENIEPLKDLKVVSSYTSRMSFGAELLAMHHINDFGEGFLSGRVLVLSNGRLNKALATFFQEHYGVKVLFKRMPEGAQPEGTQQEGTQQDKGIYQVVAQENRSQVAD